MAYRLGIDIGGTFTDATLIDEETGEIWIAKLSSTPIDPSEGFLAVTQRILRENNVAPSAASYVVHGTTVATNAIIEGKVARTGFITTDGFRDMLEIGRQTRPSLYDLQFEKPKPLVPRYLCFGVSERLDAQGKVLTPLDEEAARHIAAQLRAEQVESIAVCLLHAYANPEHEKKIGQIIQDVFPEVMLSLSSEVAPEFREYYRASTTVINAGIRPIVARYLSRIEEKLRQDGVQAELLLMQSSGGVFSFAEAIRKPVFMVESGPAAGVISAAYLGNTLGQEDVISFDMGGTTAKVGLIMGGSPKVTKDYEVGAAAQAGVGSQRGAGYPIRTPVIDLVEIGAGGGSIAWVDSGGILRVGPESAGADPGPVCYGRGGRQPTITDANLVLGRLQPDFFLKGEIELDVALAHAAIKEYCADPLGMAVVDAAYGIIEIANAAMVNALRLISVQRGYDPREYALISFGGAGPLHANRLMVEAEMGTLIVPMSPGTFSALGLLVTDLKHDFSTTFIARIEQLDAAVVRRLFADLEQEGGAALSREGVEPHDAEYVRQVDIRYVGQSFELTIPLSDRPFSAADVPELLTRFYQEHDRAYGFSVPDEPVEIVNLRLTAVGKITKPRLREVKNDDGKLQAAQIARRRVYFAESQGYADCPFYDRYQLRAGHKITGPAVVIELDSTTVVHPGYRAVVDQFGNLIITAGGR